MEILVLILVWLMATFSANERDFGFALFLVFSSLGGIAWLWRSRLAKLNETIEKDARQTEALRSELRTLTDELRLMKMRVEESAPPATEQPAAARVKISLEPPIRQPEAVPTSMPVQQPSKPFVSAPAPIVPAPVAKPVDFPKPETKPTPVAPPLPPRPATMPAFAANGAVTAPPVVAATHVAPPLSAPAPGVKGIGMNAGHLPSAPHKLKKSLDLEELVGRNLLPKAGIFLLVIGSVSLIATQWQNIPAFGKDLLLLAAAGLLLGLGIFLERKERYELFGRVLIGGGWAMLFYTSYALYHVNATRVLPTQWIDLIIMLGTAAGMVWHTLKYRSQLVTGIAYLLAFTTVAISQETVFSLVAGAVLAISLVVLVHRMRWYELEVFGILASYLNHFRFLFSILGANETHQMFPQFYASTGLLLFYWAVFRGSYVARRIVSKHEENVSTFACLLNSFLLLGLMKYQSVRPQLAFYALLGLGAIEFLLGQLPVTRRRRIAFLILTTLGSTLMIAAVPFKFSGMNTAVLWLAGAEALLIAGILTREVAFRRLGMLAALAAATHVFFTDLQPWMQSIANGNTVERDLTLGILLAICASVIFGDAHLLQLRWKDLFQGKWDRWLLGTLSFTSGLIAFCALWILLPPPGLAVGWSALMFAFAFASNRLKRTELTIQTVLLAAAAATRIFSVNFQTSTPEAAHTRLWTVAAAAALFYLSARFAEIPELGGVLRAGFQWMGTAIVAALLWVELPMHWVAPAWTLFAIVLTLAARKLRVRSLLHQCYALSAAALVVALDFNWPLEHNLGHLGISLRLITVALVAAGFYLLAIIAPPQSDSRAVFRAAFNTGAAFLLGGLIWFEAGHTWAPVVWAGFATVLLVLWRKLDFAEFLWHANALAAAALVNAYVFNMFLESRIHGVSTRLITVLLAAIFFYIDAWLSSKDARASWSIQASEIYSWAGRIAQIEHVAAEDRLPIRQEKPLEPWAQ